MKRKLSVLIVSVFMMLAVIMPQTTNVKAANNLTRVQINVKFNQTDARSMLSMINNFRAGNWWIWKGDGTKYYGSNLPALKYNYNLEKIAMVRAAELAIRTDHLRPDDSYIFEIDGVFGENIAWGKHQLNRLIQNGSKKMQRLLTVKDIDITCLLMHVSA